MSPENLISAYGGELCNLVVASDQAETLKTTAANLACITLTQRQVCDLELLMNGAFSPLKGFMCQDDYQCVLGDMQLSNGLMWPMPVTLDVSEKFVEDNNLNISSQIALQDTEGFTLAILALESMWHADKKAEAQKVYGTTSMDHPGVQYLFEKTNAIYLGGKVIGIQLPEYSVFGAYRLTPEQQRQQFKDKGWRNIIAYQTSKMIHHLQHDLLLEIMRQYDAPLLLHPTIGSTKPGDTHYYSRVHSYEAVLKYFPEHKTLLSIMPLSMRMAGARESLWYGIIHQNYGCTHFVVGPNQALPPQQEGQEPSYASQAFIKRYEQALKIQMIAVEEYQYLASKECFLPASIIKKSKQIGERFSERKMRDQLSIDKPIPKWCGFPEVIAQMKKAHPPRSKQGFTIFFTGLSGSGKSTMAKIVYAQLIELGGRATTLLDGDVVRLNLSSELGFSKQHRDLNIRRIGFVANEITKNGGAAICAPIAPYASSRRAVRELIEQNGAFIEIHVSTPLEVCEARDRKGLYAKARAGIIREFTGISDPYEQPIKPELDIDTSIITPLEASQNVVTYLFEQGYLH